MLKNSIFSELPFFGESRERKTFAKIREHVETIYKTVVELDAAFEEFGKENYKAFKEKLNNVDLLEKKADKLRRAIEEDLYSGAFLPVSRSRILDFAENVDKVADAAEDAVKLLSFLERKEIPDELFDLLRSGVRKAIEGVEYLREGVDNIEDLNRMQDIIKKIRSKEHESDEVTHDAYEIIYRREHDARRLHLLSKLVEFISNVSDTAEDASDALSLIVLMHKI